MIFLYILLAIISLVALWFIFYFVCSILVDVTKEYTDYNVFYRSILNAASLVAIFILRIKISVSGMEKLKKDERYLFVSNHRSNLDPILAWYVFRDFNVSFVSKPENFKVPIFGRIIHRCAFLPINRDDPFKAMECINKASKLLEKGEHSVGVYPEGKRNTENEMLPFHNGVFRIAQKAKSPIAVVSVKGTDNVNKNIPFKSTAVSFDVLAIIEPEEQSGLRTNVIGERVRSILEDGLK